MESIFFSVYRSLFLCFCFPHHVGREPEVKQGKTRPAVTTLWWKTRHSADSAAFRQTRQCKHERTLHRQTSFRGLKKWCCIDSWRTQNSMPASFLRTSGSSILRHCKRNCYVRHRGQRVCACVWECSRVLLWAFVYSTCSRMSVYLHVCVRVNEQ